ncbi:hypothetical protein TKK_0007982 [Trichogramma kaykai]
MSDSFSEEGTNEIIENFDREASLIIKEGNYPKKSIDRYFLVYDNYKTWREEHRDSLSNNEENNLIVYFKYLKETRKLSPSTIWSIWSMLRSTLRTNEDIDIRQFQRLKSLVKNNSKGYKPKKSSVFQWNEIMKFINEAPDEHYLAAKVALIFGVCGCLRCDEIVKLLITDVKDLGNNMYLVSINENKNDYSGQFIIGELFYKIAGRWRSDMIAQGYLEESINNKKLIYQGVTHESNKNDGNPVASTSKGTIIAPLTEDPPTDTNVPPTIINVAPAAVDDSGKESRTITEQENQDEFMLWEDFEEDFNTDNIIVKSSEYN